ncbi:MAG: alpha/beta fold hydrolase [Acidimicrobiales bacterium]|nr:alpha/beta fold hydrolase [Acidimicrobiales bacterium]
MATTFVAIGIVGANPASARTNDKAKPVLFVHGYNPTSNSTNCGGDFDQMISQLRAEGFTGPMVKVGFYSGDVNCNVNLRSYGSFGDSSSWKEISKAFSRYVYTEYTSKGIAVDVVGYSMGGLIARGAVHGAQRAESGFSAPIDVEDAVTLGTPHNGAAWYSNLCLWGQCTGLKPSASEIKWLNLNGNPQGRSGTEWTVVGSSGDWVVPLSSAQYMTVPTTNKVGYSSVSHTGSGNYMHTSTVITRSGTGLALANA